MRTLSKFVLGASLTAALPSLVLAQPRGTVEVGGFGRFTQFADTLNLDSGLGGGGRAGIYIFKNLMLEMDLSYANTERTTDLSRLLNGPDTLKRVSHPLWNYRLLYNLPISGEKVKLLLGGGYAFDSYQRPRILGSGPIRGGGPSGLIGLRLGLNDWLSARIEGIGNYVPARDEAVKVVQGGTTIQTYDRPSSFNLGGQAGLSINMFGSDQSLVKPKTKIVRDTLRLVSRDTVYQTRIDTIKAPTAGPMGMAEVVIGAVNFDYAKDGVTTEAKVILDQIAMALSKPENAGRKVNIIGNTDGIGSTDGNRRLGQRRADGVAAYLKSKGVKDSQIGEVSTRGKENPIAPNSTANSRATNRRVLVILAN
jgi:outer membrane protein OmpA-like peptidoglycan-associated protein